MVEIIYTQNNSAQVLSCFMYLLHLANKRNYSTAEGKRARIVMIT